VTVVARDDDEAVACYVGALGFRLVVAPPGSTETGLRSHEPSN